MTMTAKEQTAFNALPPVPEGAQFSVTRVFTMFDPHPFTIGPRHVAHASDHFSGMLGEAALEDAERKGIHCAHPGCRLSYRDHKAELAVEVVVPGRLESTKDVPGLHEWLLEAKAPGEAAGIAGFAFPSREQVARLRAA